MRHTNVDEESIGDVDEWYGDKLQEPMAQFGTKYDEQLPLGKGEITSSDSRVNLDKKSLRNGDVRARDFCILYIFFISPRFYPRA